MPETIYGRKHWGKSRFVVVAPHAAGDDLKTGVIASRLAASLSGALVVNSLYKKTKNFDPDYVEDFNRLLLAPVSQKYLWQGKKRAMRFFYQDIASYCNAVLEKHATKAVAIYIHGMHHKNVGIDISAGLRHQGSRLFGSKYHAEVGVNSGAVTLKINQAKAIFNFLKKELSQNRNLDVTMGKSFSGWSQWSGIQFHKNLGRNDYALQLEVNQDLRTSNDDINYLVKILTQVLKEVF